MQKKQRGCRCRWKGVGYFLIAVGLGLFLAYVIPRYILITLFGIGLIAAGAFFLAKNK